jgi:hypothetical protein
MTPKEFTPLPQITIKALGGDGKDAIRANEGKGGTVFMCRIYGEIADIKTKEARTGDVYDYFIGEFRAVDAEGKGYESSKLFLPSTIKEPLQGALGVSDGKPVKFGFDIFANPDNKTTIGYRYATKGLVKTEASDRLVEMGAALAEMPLPTMAAKSEGKPATKK